MNTEERRRVFESSLINELHVIQAWVILPNHYHLLAVVELSQFREQVRLFHSRFATAWNREDHTKGRKVWFRFQDRLIRNEAHYLASINYIHANPVKHAHVAKASDWSNSSLVRYVDEHGREAMVKLWRDYPVDQYGSGWDEEPERHSVGLRG